MKYENLDYDTRNIIETMCKNTGKTKEQAILALVEFGMVSMIATTKEKDDCEKLIKKISDIINANDKMKITADAYSKIYLI
jgi:hypothetical protein